MDATDERGTTPKASGPRIAWCPVCCLPFALAAPKDGREARVCTECGWSVILTAAEVEQEAAVMATRKAVLSAAAP